MPRAWRGLRPSSCPRTRTRTRKGKRKRLGSRRSSRLERKRRLKRRLPVVEQRRPLSLNTDALKKFVDDNGNLKASLGKDVKGILSFHEASFLLTEREDSSHKVTSQTSMLLKSLEGNKDSGIADRISHALELPLHRRMVMLEARWHIKTYNKREDANQVLLELAKHLVLQRDLKHLSRWWNNLGLASKLSFSRDKLMECFFWTVGMDLEPQLSSCHKGLTKVDCMITAIDDLYDLFGTLDELEVFTDAVKRWDVNAVKDLPGCMKLGFLALYNTINETAYDTLIDKGQDILPYLRKGWADMCEAFLEEATWICNKCVPSLEDYLENGWRTRANCTYPHLFSAGSGHLKTCS